MCGMRNSLRLATPSCCDKVFVERYRVTLYLIQSLFPRQFIKDDSMIISPVCTSVKTHAGDFSNNHIVEDKKENIFGWVLFLRTYKQRASQENANDKTAFN